MAKIAAGVVLAIVMSPIYLIGLIGIIIGSPFLLARRLLGLSPQRRGPPGRLARIAKSQTSEEWEAIRTFLYLAVILTGCLVAIFAIGVSPVAVGFVGLMATLGALGAFNGGGGPGGDGGGGGGDGGG